MRGGGGVGDFEKKFPASACRKKKIPCSTNVIDSLWGKKGKKYPAHQIDRKKILDDQKSPTTPPSPQELNGRPLSTLKQLYYTLIYPYLTYGLMSWGTAYQTKLNKIKVSQNNCIRCIFFANKRESPTPYFTLLEILKLENIFKLKIGTLVHKIQYQKKDTPPALYDLVQPASAVHNYNTRYATNQNLCRPFSRTNYGLARFSVVASQTWEATPTKIKCLPLNSFKKEYKLFLLDSQAS